jgi:hypothetical protein
MKALISAYNDSERLEKKMKIFTDNNNVLFGGTKRKEKM